LSDYSADELRGSNIVCCGFFQHDKYYVPIRDRILAYLSGAGRDDYWIAYEGSSKEYIRDFLSSRPLTEKIGPKDIVVSLRLDDFIQLPNPTSDILSPRYYTDILDKWFSTEGREDGRLILVCDRIRAHWEHQYIEFFQKWSPILNQNSLMDDFALMRDCPALIHSNSTLCWMASFLSTQKIRRFIPVTGVYPSQHLEAIDGTTDSVAVVRPMSHSDVFGLNSMCWHRDLKSLPYSIPDEVFVERPVSVADKKYVVAPLIPGGSANYLFGAGEECQYYEMYRRSMFAVSQKKGGWDCLRHYEILANGCIPIFEDLDNCPADTLVGLPKTLLKEAYSVLLPWRDTVEQREAYDTFASRLLEEARLHCSVGSAVERFFRGMSHLNSPKRILLLVGDGGVNYTRDLTWIGLKQWSDTAGALAVEWPTLEYLYDSYPTDKLAGLYGNGFTYSRRLSSQLRVQMNEETVVQSIKSKLWDIIVYGKVGPDEMSEGSLPNLPFWKHVFKRYSRDEIVFWYGGDGMQDMTYANRYSDHLVRHSQHAHCFVRELIRWPGAHQYT
jgi:hypothetical protein